MRLYSFEKLDVWQKSRELNKLITLSFPSNEQFGLTSQLRRASISVMLNIAEGTSRISGKEQGRFTEIAYSSLMEVLSSIIIARDLDYIKDETILEIRPLIEELSNKLNSLRKSQLNK